MNAVNRLTLTIVCAAALAGGCQRSDDSRLQGYVEGDFVYVSSPLSGTITRLAVQRGQQVAAGDELFELDNVPEKAALDEAQRRVAQAEANLEDTTKGKRQPEIDSLQAQISQAQVMETMAEEDLTRLQKMAAGAASQQDLDHARTAVDADRQQIARLEADLATARLGSREDLIDAARQEVAARQAELATARWNLSQKRQAADQSEVVFDTLYREGEWVAAGRPVVELLPPANVKVRVFVPESRLGAIHVGQKATVFIDGAPETVTGTVNFISPQAEYTPPVIYSDENRSKLVFLVELVFAPSDAAGLHPGQPVEVEPGS
jgi:HlyD family secretion protein